MRKDLTNKKFGRLQVLKQADNIKTPNGRSHVAWLCECECGNQIIVRGDNLRNGHTVSCGCRKREILAEAGKNRISDFTGKTFGRLTVKGDSGKRENNGGVLWECECSCGNIIYVSSHSLSKGSTLSSNKSGNIPQLIRLERYLFVAYS